MQETRLLILALLEAIGAMSKIHRHQKERIPGRYVREKYYNIPYDRPVPVPQCVGSSKSWRRERARGG